MKRRGNRARLMVWGLVALTALQVVTCAESKGPRTDSETHWLSVCPADDDCGDLFSCHCGVCTLACAETAECEPADSAATCLTPTVASCLNVEPTEGGGACLAECVTADDCDLWGDHLTCQANVCLPNLDAPEPDDAPDSGADADIVDDTSDEPDASTPCEDGYEPNDTFEEAKTMQLPFGCIDPAGDVDVFTFETVTQSQLYMEANGIESEMLLTLTLDNAELGRFEQTEGSMYIHTAPPGIHYLTISSTSTGPYIMHIGISPRDQEPNDTFDEAPRVPARDWLLGCIEPVGDHDMWEFEMLQTTDVSVDVLSAVAVTVYDDTVDHAVVLGPTTENFARRFEPGIYYMDVEAADPTATLCYELMLSSAEVGE